MLFALFALWSLPFWLVVAAAAIVIIMAVENEKSFISILSLISLFIFLEWVVKISIIHFVFTHPGAIAIYAIIFLLVGVFWAIAKWYFFLRKSFNRYKEIVIDYLHAENVKSIGELTDSKRSILALKTSSFYNPQVSHHKADVIFWMMYWPFSMIGTVLNDLVRKIFHHIYFELSGMLQRMSDKMFNVKK